MYYVVCNIIVFLIIYYCIYSYTLLHIFLDWENSRRIYPYPCCCKFNTKQLGFGYA